VSTSNPPSEADFQQIFAAEAEGRLDTLGDQLIELEKSGASPDLVASLFREAHTIKGGAAVVGLPHVARVAHALEDLLEEVRRERRQVDAGLIDAVLAGVDAIRGLIPIAVAGEDHERAAFEAEQRLRIALGGHPVETPAAPAAVPQPVEAPTRAHPLAVEASVSPEMPAAGEAQLRRAGAARLAPSPSPAAAPPGDHLLAGEGPHHVAPETLQMPVHRIDELVRLIGEASASTLRLGGALLDRLECEPSSLSEYRDLARCLNELQELALHARMIPVMSLAPRLRRAVRDLARDTGKQIRFETRGEDAEIDRGVLERLADPLLHLVRNAVDHGIELPEERRSKGKPSEGVVRLHAMQIGSEVVIAVNDDGRGIDVGRVREAAGQSDSTAMEMDDESALYLIFRSGLSTAARVTDVSGRGVGLDAVRASLNAVRGRIEVRSDAGLGTEFRIAVPITMATLRCLVVVSAGRRYGIPLHSVRAVLAPQRAATIGGQDMTMLDGRPVPISSLAGVLGTGNGSAGPAVVVSGLTRSHALEVDELIDQRDIVVKGFGELVPRLPAIAGAGIQPDGTILLVLEAAGLIERARRRAIRGVASPDDTDGIRDAKAESVPALSASILVVDDALTIRELQRSIFEHAGYRVRTAANGEEALERMTEDVPDLVLTDIEMPQMDGFQLTAAIRGRPALASVPVIILTSRGSEESRRRGLEVGADGYIVKSGFDQVALLSAVERLLGTSQ
jgi:two-component system chemotaxis sensor kinase CheA